MEKKIETFSGSDGGDLVEEFPFFPVNLDYSDRCKALYTSEPYPGRSEDGYIAVEGQETIVFDGFMSSFYEREFNRIVPNAHMYLMLEVKGKCRIVLFHRTQDGVNLEYKRIKISTDSEDSFKEVKIDFDIIGSEAHLGRWYFSITSLEKKKSQKDLLIKSVTWGVFNVRLKNVKPCFAICTYKREKQLSNNIDSLISVLDGNYEDYVINIIDNAQTFRKRSDWPDNVRVIPQRNVGGAGGFGRGILEAIKEDRCTHITMLDDDADIDIISIKRLLNLFSLSEDANVFLGGAQLDVYDPVRLADGGAHWIPDRFERPYGRLPPSYLGDIAAKDELMRNHPLNFNGWWLFGGTLEGFKNFGMPLPCFVHLDDVEYGVRLTMQGGEILSMPGVAVWHEPYYAKPEGWFAYYNIRNELVRMACHTEILYRKILAEDYTDNSDALRKRIGKLMENVAHHLQKRFNGFIRIYHYGSAALLIQAIEDFLKGPSVFLESDASNLHASIMNLYKENNENYKFSLELPLGSIPTPPGTTDKFIVPWNNQKNKKNILFSTVYRFYQDRRRNAPVLKQSLRPLSTLSRRKRQLTLFNSRNDINWREIHPGRSWAYYDPQKVAYHSYAYDEKKHMLLSKKMAKILRRYRKNVYDCHFEWSNSYEEMISKTFWEKLSRSFEP
ncbi:glycosyltransferase [Saccharibacter floricola]|uniref:Glycosyltransferase n=1 Tax=Saccharibacter floricola DSM 15669 TaxID=1123227 RepID=A0ABQ0P066_9PROT|nr:glycosyltransferase [Saccharibacter floricola]GBQ07918.1 glycosyltransferase [Saccharibacter floricola DSM 15669]